ncbi:MAG TPA: HAD-IIIC family phosphatase [Bryobacteraceae bacterium]|nr:HAD-IIIC family phosphatase [Bryobacteraceae bacterium]
MELSDLRHEIEELLAGGEWREASWRLQVLWDKHGSAPLAGFAVTAYSRLRDQLKLASHRCAILRSFTVEPIVPILKACAFRWGIDLDIHVGEFNAYAQELLDGSSRLYAFHPDSVILAVRTHDLAPELEQGASYAEVVDRVTGQYAGWIRAFRGNSTASLIVHTLERPAITTQGVYDSQLMDNQANAIEQINRNLRKLAAEHRGIYFLDYDALVARHGREHWGDERKWLSVRLPVAAANLIYMAQEWMKFLAPLAGRQAKCVAVDLDNTLWGGVIGEDGMAGIQLGPEYPGAAYQAMQRALLDLSRRGILLAVSSKNNPQDAWEVLRDHPGMLLEPEDFTAMRTNWNDKAQSLREIAAELNIGLDAMAFVDDNPLERQQVREQLPEVMVVELPSDPLQYARSVRDCPVFERLTLSDEDRQRGTYYAAERERQALEQSAPTREDFYRSLAQEAEIAPVNALTLARVAQLTQKTNQFNLTTRRYTEQQIAELARRPGWRLLSIQVRDRYADNGLVGVAITCDRGAVCEIDTFLLSCRVIGRTIETALIASLAEEARARGARRLDGWFLPTKKNAPAKDFFAQHRFQLISESAEGQHWGLDLTSAEPRVPQWVRVFVAAEKV